MNNNKNLIANDLNLSPYIGLPLINKYDTKGLNDLSLNNIINKNEEIKLENNKSINNNKKSTDLLNNLIDQSNLIIDSTKSNNNIINKSKIIYNIKKENIKFNKENNLLNVELNHSISSLQKIDRSNKDNILMNERKYIKMITPFNSKLLSFTNQFYTFTLRPTKIINQDLHNLYLILSASFLSMSSLISKPIVLINPNLIKIKLFFYWKPLNQNLIESNQFSKFLLLYRHKLEKLLNLLSKLFNKSVELELIRLYSPQKDSNILANLIGIISNFIKFRYIHKKLFKITKIRKLNKSLIRRFSSYRKPSFLSGIYLKLAGRVLTQKMQRRVKSNIIQKGSLSRNKATIITNNRFVNKNKRGAFSITIKTGHIIYD